MGFNVTHLIGTVGILGVALMVFAESGALLGFGLPGDTLLLTTGLLARSGALHTNIHLIVAILFLSAAAGDSVGYAIGKRAGPRIFSREDSFFFRRDHLVRAEAFFARHGPKTILLARFVPVIRMFAPILAGVGTMRYRTFVAFNLAGSLLWTASITYLGYFAGAQLQRRGINIEHWILPIIALGMLAGALPAGRELLRDRERRARLFARFRRRR